MREISGDLFKRCFMSAYERLKASKEHVNELNVFPVPDGDTGTNMSMTIESAIESMGRIKSDRPGDIAKAIGNGSLMGARGNSGVILSQLCRGMADALKDKDKIDIKSLIDVFRLAKERAYKAVMKPTEGTILTVAASMSTFAERNDKQTDIITLLKGVLREGNQALQRTPDMLPALKEAGVVDAGGQGLIYLVTGFVEELIGESLEELLSNSAASAHSTEITDSDARDHEVSELAYFIKLKVRNIDGDRLIRAINRHGLLENINSKDGCFLVKASTDTPDKLLSSVYRRGKIEEFNMSDMDNMSEKANIHSMIKEELKPRKKVAFVAVSLGEGFEAIFKQMMVDEIVSGGQTMNPSTKDLYVAVEACNAETVFLLPNNKNIIMAAEQVDHLSSSKVIVIPSKSIPQGLTALFAYDSSLSDEENKEAMTDALSDVITGQTTYAVRDTEINGLKIKKDDRICIIDGEIVGCGLNDLSLIEESLEKRCEDNIGLVTFYRGLDGDNKGLKELAKKLSIKYPDLDIEVEEGGQPTYSYIFSIE